MKFDVVSECCTNISLQDVYIQGTHEYVISLLAIIK